MVEALKRDQDDLAKLRHDLIGAGAQLSGIDPLNQLPTAAEHADWAILEQFILNSSAEFACLAQGDLAGAAGIPRTARQQRPILSVAHAVANAIDPISGVLDLGQLTRLLLGDARELHSGWRGHTGVDALVTAGTLWMISQASSDLTASSPGLDESWTTHQELEDLIRSASRSGPLPSSASLALFHSLSSVLAVLRADWAEATRHAEPAMLLAPECGLIGFVAAGMLAIASFFSGSSIGRERSERFFQMHRTHDCQSLAWMSRTAAVSGFLGALRDLDRERAEAYLVGLTDFDSARWFDDSMLVHCIAARAGILWTDPQRALAAFDGAVSSRWTPEQMVGGAQLVAGKTRVELLLNVGDLDQAVQLLDRLHEVYGPESLVSLTAKVQLYRGDYQGALSVVESGLNASANPLRRATLLVFRATALMMGNGTDAAVDRALTSACVICEETKTLLPFGMVAWPLLSDLLKVHGPHPDGHPCFLKRNLNSTKIAALQRAQPTLDPPIRLTPRERTLLPLLATPDTLGEIAGRLFVSVNTVRKQVATLREKLSAKDRRELVARANELRLLPEGPA